MRSKVGNKGAADQRVEILNDGWSQPVRRDKRSPGHNGRRTIWLIEIKHHVTHPEEILKVVPSCIMILDNLGDPCKWNGLKTWINYCGDINVSRVGR
jgi:hypothetical protein